MNPGDGEWPVDGRYVPREWDLYVSRDRWLAPADGGPD